MSITAEKRSPPSPDAGDGSTPLRGLLVCPEARARLVRRSFDRASELEIEIEIVDRLELALEMQQTRAADVVLLECERGDSKLADRIARLREVSASTAILVLSRLDDRALRRESLVAGADDFLVTAWVLGTASGPRLLERSVQFAIERRRQLTEIERLKDRFRQLALYDPLTGIPNRRGLEAALERAATRCERDATPLSVALADCDDFKGVNETHGHAAGDTVLHEIAERLTQAIRNTDTAARVGGDEFILLFPGTDIATAVEVAERARQAIARDPVQIDLMQGLTTTMSFGVACVDPAGVTIETLLTSARRSLESSKELGKNGVRAVSPTAGPPEEQS